MKSHKDVLPEVEPFGIEKKELETVLAAGLFAVSSNAARLLRFVCERRFEDGDATATEYDIAVNALGRRSDFDPRQDSIVRVEAHRVRKRLKEYYEADGASHDVRIVLPAGQYTPQFLHARAIPELRKPEAPPGSVGMPAGLRQKRRLLPAVLLTFALAVGLAWALLSARKAPAPAATHRAGEDMIAGARRLDTIRILAGLLSGDYVDRIGTRWMADAYFTGGTATSVRYYSLALADDPAIYQHCRSGETFAYDIPLRPGTYEMRLMFAESAETAPVLGAVGDGSRVFAVTANGVQILPPADGRHLRQFDIFADAGGSNTASVKVFKDITPAPDGKLHLRFASRKQRALVNAIEIVPGLKGKMWPLRWRASETPYADHSGKLWLSDRYFRGGRLSRFHDVVTRTPAPELYEGERFGSFTYHIPIVAGGSYAITIQFAENFFGTWTAPLSPPRMFNVYANQVQLLRDFDVYREAGGNLRALTRTFHGIKSDVFDKIVLRFEPVTDYAIVNAVEVEDEAR